VIDLFADWLMIICRECCCCCCCRCRKKCAAKLDHLAVHLFVVMATVVSVIGVTALLLIRLDIIQGGRGLDVSGDVIKLGLVFI